MASFATILTRMRTTISNDDQGNKRRHPRRRTDQCVGIVNGKTFPIEDWSIGGVLLSGDDRVFTLNDNTDITLKFAFKNDIKTVTHSGRIVRKMKDRFAIEFSPLTPDVSKNFQDVISEYA